MQFMFTSPWHIKAQQVHKKMLWSHKASIFQLLFFLFFLKQLHISPSQEKRGRLMWRWWGFFVFVLFFSVPFSQPLWHNPRKNSRHFRHDSRTISETLWQTSCTIKRALTATRRQVLKWTVDRKQTRTSSKSQSDREIWSRAFADARVYLFI